MHSAHLSLKSIIYFHVSNIKKKMVTLRENNSNKFVHFASKIGIKLEFLNKNVKKTFTFTFVLEQTFYME